MNIAERFAYSRIRSFRRENGGLYGLYVAIYSRVYVTVMLRRHQQGRHGSLMGISGRCSWCGKVS